jgi:hypothetical protein
MQRYTRHTEATYDCLKCGKKDIRGKVPDIELIAAEIFGKKVQALCPACEEAAKNEG